MNERKLFQSIIKREKIKNEKVRVNLEKNYKAFKFKSTKGITLIALVISIIVMLILAGVSLNATIGDNGIITQAQNAKKIQELAKTKENLEYMFFDYNVGESDTKTISEFLNSKVTSGDIDEFKVYPVDGNLKMVIKKDGNYFYVNKVGEYYSAIQMDTELGNINSGFTVVTKDEFNNLKDGSMKFELKENEDSTLIFYDEINDSFNFEVLGGNVTIYVNQNMTLTNKGMKRSAIDIHSGATLNIHIDNDVTMTVDSGLGIEGETTGKLGAKGGEGGYAGIHVPEGANLNIYGKGTIIAYGGNAGTGGGAVGDNTGGAGGGGAGAGIGGNGGAGGDANSTFGHMSSRVGTNDSGFDGKNGENAGNINIYENVKIFAYGGGGASGGKSPLDSHYTNSGAGAGGYPAAGIGGGGAGGGGGDHCKPGGGYSGGAGEPYNIEGINGLGTTYVSFNTDSKDSLAGGYYTYAGLQNSEVIVGWFGLGGAYFKTFWSSGGSGGIAGNGGNIKASSNSTIYAYNGDRITNGDYSSTYYQYDKSGNLTKEQANVIIKKNNMKFIPTFIFIQSGIRRAVYADKDYISDELASRFEIDRNNVDKRFELISENSNIQSYGQGIGSGAGYVELSNGTYVIDDTMN